MKIKKGDTVVVIRGSDRKKEGEVLKVFPLTDRVVVKGVNVRIKNKRPRVKGEKGTQVSLEGPIHISNVAFINPATKKRTRIRITRKDGVRTRIATKGNKMIEEE